MRDFRNVIILCISLYILKTNGRLLIIPIINNTTKKYHTEYDCRYTLVSIPKQDCVQDYVFFFRLKSNKYIGIPMKSGASFVSSMKLLTHRQQKIADLMEDLVEYLLLMDLGGKIYCKHVTMQQLNQKLMLHNQMVTILLMYVHMLIVVY